MSGYRNQGGGPLTLMLLALLCGGGGCASYQDIMAERAGEAAAAQPAAVPADPRERFIMLCDRCAGGDREAMDEVTALYQGTLADRTLAYQEYATVQAFERCADAMRRFRENEVGQALARCSAQAQRSDGHEDAPARTAPEPEAPDDAPYAGDPDAAEQARQACEEAARLRSLQLQSELSELSRLVIRDEMRCALFARHFYAQGDAVNGAFWLQRLIDYHGREYAYSFAGRMFLHPPQTAVSGARMLSEAARAGSGEAQQLLFALTQPGTMAYHRLLSAGEDTPDFTEAQPDQEEPQVIDAGEQYPPQGVDPGADDDAGHDVP